MTNADRIREMTDEELVQFIMSPCMKWNEPCPRNSCFDCLYDWLRKEANDGN